MTILLDKVLVMTDPESEESTGRISLLSLRHTKTHFTLGDDLCMARVGFHSSSSGRYILSYHLFTYFCVKKKELFDKN